MPPPLGKNNKLRSAEMAAIAASLFGMVATAQAETPDDLPSTEDTPGAMPPPERAAQARQLAGMQTSGPVNEASGPMVGPIAVVRSAR